MELIDFLMELSIFFPIKGVKTEKDILRVLEAYKAQLEPSIVNKGLNLKKLLRWIVDNYEYKTFPEVSYIKSNLDRGKVVEHNNKVGQLLYVELPDGKTYTFTVANFGFNSIGDFRNKLFAKYGNDAKFTFYPEGTVIIDGRVFTP